MWITFIRHGNTDKENSGDGPLTKKGIKQAKALARRLKKESFDEFYCSDMKRAKQTSEIVAKKIKINSEIKNCLNEFKTETLKKDNSDWTKEEKQSFERLNSFLEEISKNPDEDRKILIIAHGIVNRIILSKFIGLDISKTLFFRQRETGINRIYWIEKFKNWRVAVWNDICHISKRLK